MRRILMVSSLPLSEPWNGADKNLARSIVLADTANSYVVRTGIDDRWPATQVTAVRAAEPSSVPNLRESLSAFAYMVRNSQAVDLIHVVASLSRPTRWLGKVVRAWSKVARTPVIHTIPSLGDRPLSHHYFFGDATVVLSRFSRSRLHNHGVGNVYQVFPPLDASLWLPPADQRAAAWRLGLGDRAVLYPAHFGDDSGIREILAAFARLPADLADAELVLACRTRTGQVWSEEANKVQSWVRALGLENRVRVPQAVEMREWLSACALTALVPQRLASKMDLPMVMLESLAMEKPVIVGDAPPICEAALGGGLLVPFGDLEALAEALTELLRDPSLRKRLASAGRSTLLANARPQLAAAKYQAIYEQVLRQSAGTVSAATSEERAN